MLDEHRREFPQVIDNTILCLRRTPVNAPSRILNLSKTVPSALNQFLQRFGCAVIERIGDFDGPSRGAHVLLFPVDAECFIDGGIDIAHADGAAYRIEAALITGSDHLTAADASSAQGERPAVWPVVAAESGIELRGPAKLSHGEDDRGIEQAA